MTTTQTALLTIITSEIQNTPLTITILDTYGLLTFNNGNTCVIKALTNKCTIGVTASTVTKTKMGHLSFTLLGDSDNHYPYGINNISYAVYPITNKEPYTLAFWANYSGYNLDPRHNRHTLARQNF